MRFEQLLLSSRGLRGADAYTKYRLEGDVVAAKWLLWNGRKERCFEELEALRRETGWVGAHNPLGKVIRYLRGCSALLVNYARRRALNIPVSSAGAASAVDYVIGQRLKRSLNSTTTGKRARPARAQHLPAIFALRNLGRRQANEILETRKAA